MVNKICCLVPYKYVSVYLHTCVFLFTLVFATFHKEIHLHLVLCMVLTVLATKAFEIHNKRALNQSEKILGYEPCRKFIGGVF